MHSSSSHAATGHNPVRMYTVRQHRLSRGSTAFEEPSTNVGHKLSSSMTPVPSIRVEVTLETSKSLQPHTKRLYKINCTFAILCTPPPELQTGCRGTGPALTFPYIERATRSGLEEDLDRDHLITQLQIRHQRASSQAKKWEQHA